MKTVLPARYRPGRLVRRRRSNQDARAAGLAECPSPKASHKADTAPHVDMGDQIVVGEAQKSRVTGAKLSARIYYTPYRTQLRHQVDRRSRQLPSSTPSGVSSSRVKGMTAEEPARPAHVQEAARVAAVSIHTRASSRSRPPPLESHRTIHGSDPAQPLRTGRARPATGTRVPEGRAAGYHGERPFLEEFFGARPAA